MQLFIKLSFKRELEQKKVFPVTKFALSCKSVQYHPFSSLKRINRLKARDPDDSETSNRPIERGPGLNLLIYVFVQRIKGLACLFWSTVCRGVIWVCVNPVQDASEIYSRCVDLSWNENKCEM